MTLRDFYLKRAKAEFPVILKVLRALPEDLSYKQSLSAAVEIQARLIRRLGRVACSRCFESLGSRVSGL